MSSELADPVLTVLRTVTYTGYVLLAGILLFWLVVWPGGGRDRRLAGLVVAGTALMTVGTLGDPLIRLTVGDQSWGDFLDPVSGGALMVRLAALAATAFFLPDLVRERLVGWRQGFAFVVVIALAASIVTGSSGSIGPSGLDSSSGPGGDEPRGESLILLASSGHVLAAAAWIGGLVALAVLLLPPRDTDLLDAVVPQVSRVTAVSVAVLVVGGAVQVAAVAGTLSGVLTSAYGLLLGLKTALLVAVLVLGHRVRRGRAPRVGIVVGAEVVLALAVLAATAVLVSVGPPG